MIRRQTGIILCLTAVAIWSGGCMVGPDYERPGTVAEGDGGFVYGAGNINDVNRLPEVDYWWEQFGDEATAQLVRQALMTSNDLRAAAARVLQAEAALRQSEGVLWPDISYNISRTRSKNSFNFGGGRISPLTTTYSQAFSVGYILDLWGGLRRAQRAAWADMLAVETNRQALTNSVIAAVIKARIDIATLQRRLEIAKANTESRRRTLEIVERRYEQGLVGPVDVRLARENLASAQAQEPLLENLLVSARLALDVLLGRRPGHGKELPQTLAELPELKPLVLGQPAGLLDRRPDVQAAEFALRAANERIGVSIAQMLPNLTLSGSLGRSADTWDDIWINETEVYSAVINAAQPIFKGGQLRAQVDASKATFQELSAAYAQVVVTAIKEVEESLASERLLQDQLKYVKIQVTEARSAEQLSRERYQRGVENLLSVLESERRRRIGEEAGEILKGQIWRTRVNLHLALGGTWVGPNDMENEDSYAAALNSE